LEALVEPETAGDPCSDAKWVDSSLRSLSRRLADAGHRVSPPTVRRLPRERTYPLRANVKYETGPDPPDRDEQFCYLEQQKQALLAAGQPVISVDTKKQELIGNFATAGRRWRREAERVNVHDFCQDAIGRAVPYGIYELGRHQGAVYVGESAETPRSAVDAMVRWWQEEGQAAYPEADALLVLADGGGSNGCQPRAWKGQIQERLADRLGLTVTVCHYPMGCSKWNPVEHRLFGPISVNWAGEPLRTFETMVVLIQGTTTTGLTVRAERLRGEYPKGETLTNSEMKQLSLERHAIRPRWNYIIRPRLAAAG
jgi:hypothetical protein